MKDKKIGTVIKTESKVIAYVVICLVIIVLGISYALFFEVKGNEKNQIVKAGTLEFTYEKGSQITYDTNSDCFIPMNEEEAIKHSECEYKISITNAGTLPGNYNIKLNSETVDKPLALNKLKIILKKEGEIVDGYPKEGTTTSLVENEKIEAGSVINYSVQIYVDADNELLNADDDEKNISLKINGDAVVNSEDVNPTMPAVDYLKLLAQSDSVNLAYDGMESLGELGTEDNNLRYIGANPNNYVLLNGEKWRIIGIIDKKLKIIRNESLANIAWDDNNSNVWSNSKVANYLNETYSLDSNLITVGNWNIGGADSAAYSAKDFYTFEQSEHWNGKVGLITPSDYGYAVGGNVRKSCLTKNLYNYADCYLNDWLKPSSEYAWTMISDTFYSNSAFSLYSNGSLNNRYVYNSFDIWPVVYLKSTVKISNNPNPELEYGSIDNPFVLEA